VVTCVIAGEWHSNGAVDMKRAFLNRRSIQKIKKVKHV